MLNLNINPNSKLQLNELVNNFVTCIDSIMASKDWCKIYCFEINSDNYRNARVLKNYNSSYAIYIQLVYRMPYEKQGFVLINLNIKDGDFEYTRGLGNIFRMNMSVVLFFRQNKLIDRTLEEPKHWKYSGGYNMDINREVYNTVSDIGFDTNNLEKIEFDKLIDIFTRLSEDIDKGDIKNMKLHTLIPSKYDWPNIENYFWSSIGNKLNKFIINGTGLFSIMNDHITLAEYIKRKNNSLRYILD